MSAPTLVTVEAYGILDLPDAIRDRVVERERSLAWCSWVRDEVAERLVELMVERLDGVVGVAVTAWSILDGGRGSMVVEGDVVDPDALATSLGLAGHDVGEGLRLAPYHGRGGQWAGTTDVLRYGDDGADRDDVLTEALGDLMGEALNLVEVWAEDVTSDEALVESLDGAGWCYDRLGRELDLVIVDAPEGVIA
jgi:hypothetical protein